MTHEEYYRERARLLVVLQDATNRGDYNLEMDMLEALTNLQNRYQADEA